MTRAGGLAHLLLFAVCLVVHGSVQASAQVIRPEALAVFVEQSGAQFRLTRESDLEYVLYEIAKSNPSPDVAIATFAQRLGVSTDAARGYAAAIIESVALKEVCDRKTLPCVFEPGGELHTLLVRAGTIDVSGRVLVAVARNLSSSRIDRGVPGAAFVNVVAAHPASHVVFRSLLDWTSHPLYLAGLLASKSKLDEQATISAIADMDPDGDFGERLGWIEAMLESAELEAASPVARATLARAAILRKLRRGLNTEALEQYDGLGPEIRALLPLPAGTCATARRDCVGSKKAAYRFVDDVAAALALAGRQQQALTLLKRRIADLGPRSPDDEPRHLALVDALVSTRPRRDLFDLFTRGRLPGQPVPKNELAVDFLDGPGWLFEITTASPAVQRIVAARLRAAGHADMATFLDAAPETCERFEYDEAFEALASLFPVRVRERRAYWQQRIEAVMPPATPASPPAASRISRRDLQPWWVERRLPDGMESWRESDVVATPPEDRDLPVDRDAVLRYERVGVEHLLVYESSDYDLPGEVPALGLWFVQTSGGQWGRPLYLGLQQHYPYVVTRGSRLPLLKGHILRLEVQVREIDSATITFPPIGLQFARSADGVYLEIDLARLRADRDSDGLTDIEERRIGLDFTNADTDGDGMSDGIDPLPLTPFRSGAFRSTGLARAILSQIIDHDARAIVVPAGGPKTLLDALVTAGVRGDRMRTPAGAHFLVADPALFSGIVTSARLMIYSQADIDDLRRDAAPFYPPQIGPIFTSLDGQTHYVSWSAQWVGGAFIVRCNASGKCNVEVVSSWIT